MNSPRQPTNAASFRSMILRASLLAAVLAAAASGCQIPIGAGIPSGKTVTGVALNKDVLSLAVGASQQLTATVSPSNATNKAISWTSSNTSAASVGSTGLVTAKAVGTAVITVKTLDGSFTDTCDVTVTAVGIPVTGVTLDIESKTIPCGGTVQLTATVLPANASNPAVGWSTSSSSVATVSAGGLVTATGLGTATITVKTNDGNKTDTASIKVVPSISLDKSSLDLTAGNSAKLVATIGPSTAPNKTVTWTSSDQDIAAVLDGTVLGIKAGTATITAAAADGSQAATCAVTVTGSLSHSYSQVLPAANALQDALSAALATNDTTQKAYCEFVTSPSWLVTIHLVAYKPSGSVYTITGTITAPVNQDYTVGAMNGTATLSGGLVSSIVYHDSVFATPRSGTVDIEFVDGKGGTMNLSTGVYTED
jgi:uncharacterized protein YjdB